MAVTIKDIAQAAGVSDTTVSLALRDSTRISPETRQRIADVARSFNYIPNSAARTLRRRGPSRTIGILVNDITNPFYARMAYRAQLTVKTRGFKIVIGDTQWAADKETAELEGMLQTRVQGILLCLSEKTNQSFEMLERAAVPYVMLDTYPPGYEGAYVVNDLPGAGRLAARHLLDVGCRCPVFVGSDPSMESFSAFAEMKRAFEGELRSRGIPCHEGQTFSGGLTVEAGVRSLEGILDRVPQVDGAFCANDLCALGIMDAADRKGIRVGADLAVMGIDNVDIAAMQRVSLTSIAQPYHNIVETAAEALLRSIAERANPTIQAVMPPKLIVRDSTRNKRKQA